MLVTLTRFRGIEKAFQTRGKLVSLLVDLLVHSLKAAETRWKPGDPLAKQRASIVNP